MASSTIHKLDASKETKNRNRSCCENVPQGRLIFSGLVWHETRFEQFRQNSSWHLPHSSSTPSSKNSLHSVQGTSHSSPTTVSPPSSLPVSMSVSSDPLSTSPSASTLLRPVPQIPCGGSPMLSLALVRHPVTMY